MTDSNAADATERFAGKTIARNTFFGLGAQLSLRVVGFLFQLFVINTLGASEFGQYSIIIAWASLFGVIGDLGINQYLGREIARDPNKTQELFWDTVVLRFFLAIFASIITVAGGIIYGYSPAIVLGIAIYTSSYFLQALVAPFNSILTGHERLDLISVLNVMTQVLFMIFAGLFLFLGLDFIWLVIASVINLPVIILLQIWFIRRNELGPPQFHINMGIWWSVIKAGLPFGFIQLSLSFAFRVDTIMLSNTVSEEQVGWYNVAYNLTLTLLTLTRSFNDAILPTLAREHALNPDTVKPWYYRSTRIMLFIGLPIAVGGMLTAPQIVDLLYRPEFAPVAAILMIIVWDIPLVMYHSFCGNLTTSVKREGSAARIYGSLGITNVLLNLLLIPYFGVLGAAFATVLTDLSGAMQFYFLFRHEFGAGLNFWRIIRLPLAAGIMGILIMLMGNLHFFIIVPVSAIFYLVIVWYIGAFTIEERRSMISIVTRRLPLKALRAS